MRFILLMLGFLTPLCQARQSAGDTPKFESKLNVVLVPVLVRDSHGKAVGTLTKEDFQVFDKDKLQTITGFTIQQRAPATLAADPAEAAVPGTPGAAPLPVAASDRSIVYLFDDVHLESADLIQVQKAAIKMLAESLTERDVAAVLSVSGKTNSGMTRDHAKLEAAVMSLRVQSLYRTIGNQCPNVSHYQADLILNKNDLQALAVATQEAIACANLDPRMRDTAERMARSSAAQSLTMGDQATRVTMQTIRQIVKVMANLPGQHTLILISPGFLSDTAEAMTLKSDLLDIAAQANVTISALDARGLYTTVIEASEGGSGTPMVTQRKSEYKAGAMNTNEDVMSELADGTGGTYFHNSNDLAGGLKRLTLAPEYLYLLEFTPENTKQDGAYHRLKVKVDQDGLKLQARRGYFALKASKKKS